MTFSLDKLNQLLPDFTRNLSRDQLSVNELKSWSEQTFLERLERVAKVACPYLQLYGPMIHPLLSPSLTLGLNAHRFYHDYSSCEKKDLKTFLQTGLSGAAVVLLASKFPQLSMVVTALQDLVYDFQQLNSLESFASIVKNLFYITSLATHKNLLLDSLFFGTTSLSYLVKALKEANRGRWLEFLGHFGLFGIQADRSLQKIHKLYPRPEGEIRPSAHSLRDIVSRHLLYWSGVLRTPLNWTGWGGGFLGYLGPEEIAGVVAMRCRCKVLPKEYDFLDSYWKEVSYRVALCALSTLVVPIAYPLALLGTLLRVAGFMVQNGLCTLIQSEKDLRAFEQSGKKYPATFGWFNACWVFGGLDRSHGGVADTSSRFHDLVDRIKKEDLTYFAMTEFYGVGDAEKFYQALKEIYPFAVIECPGNRYGGMLGATSGLVIFSKVPFMNLVAQGFENSFVLQRKAFIAADFSFDGIEKAIRVLATHLTHSSDDNRVNQEDADIRVFQLEKCLDQEPDIILGDLNIASTSQVSDLSTLNQKTIVSQGEDSYATYDNSDCIKVYNPEENPFKGVLDYLRIIQGHLTDYFLEVKSEFLTGSYGPLSDHALLKGELKKEEKKV